MSCSNLRDLGTLVTGNLGFIDYRVAPLSKFGNYSCQNTSGGPRITLRCNSCQPIQDNMYISWQFIDLPDNPAVAVGFQFNLTARSHANKRHLSFVSGTLKNGSTLDDRPVTFGGSNTNILKFSLFPRIFHNLHDLRLIQPLFHAFVLGSFFNDTSQLQASLQRPKDGILNTTLYINFLSDYIVEIDKQNIMGPVSFLADLGGLYCISIGIIFYLLVQVLPRPVISLLMDKVDNEPLRFTSFEATGLPYEIVERILFGQHHISQRSLCSLGCIH